jgi:CHASE3 domain sensor protein
VGLRRIELDRVWRIAFALAISLLLIIGAFAFQRLFSLAAANEQLGETYQAIDEINLLLSNLKDAETGQRGYLLTSDESYLTPYNSALQQIPQIEERLQNLVVNDAAQRERVNKIKTLSAARLGLLKETIEFLRAGKREQALDKIRSGEGKRLMDEIRRVFNELQVTEKESLRLRAERVRDVRTTSYAVVAAVVILSLILAFIAFLTGEEFERKNYKLKHEVKERQIAEKAFRESEERFRLALQHSPISVHQTDKEGRYTWIYNPKARVNLEE